MPNLILCGTRVVSSTATECLDTTHRRVVSTVPCPEPVTDYLFADELVLDPTPTASEILWAAKYKCLQVAATQWRATRMQAQGATSFLGRLYGGQDVAKALQLTLMEEPEFAILLEQSSSTGYSIEQVALFRVQLLHTQKIAAVQHQLAYARLRKIVVAAQSVAELEGIR